MARTYVANGKKTFRFIGQVRISRSHGKKLRGWI
jgi:hypothetical protein